MSLTTKIHFAVYGTISSTTETEESWTVCTSDDQHIALTLRDSLQAAWSRFKYEFDNRERVVCGYDVGENLFDPVSGIELEDPINSSVIYTVEPVDHLVWIA